MTARVEVFQRGGALYVVTMAKTSDTGLWILFSVDALAGDAGEMELGRIVRAALTSSPPAAKHPSRAEVEHVADPLLQVAGVRSNREFLKGAKGIWAERFGEDVRITPMKNSGPGFEHLNDDAILTNEADDYRLGVVILAALKKAE